MAPGRSLDRLRRKVPFLVRHTAILLWIVLVVAKDYVWILFRLRILEVAISSELMAEINRRNAVRIREAAVRLKGGLIKVGQFVSSRVDIVPLEYVEELSVLQDSVDPEDFSYIAGQIRHYYEGREPAEVFARFDVSPLAAASFGQVHRAQTHEGDEVAVKVQYPHIRESLAVDLAVFWVVVKVLGWLFPHLTLDDIYLETAKASWAELRYLDEAAHAERIRSDFRDDDRIVVPRPHRQYCRAAVLVTDFIDGKKINDLEAMNELGVDVTEVLTIVADAYIKQIYVNGFFQSDPHPGNLFFLPPHSGSNPTDYVKVGIVDFGQAKEMPPDVHENLRRAVFGMLMGDDELLVEALMDLDVIGEKDRPAVQELIDYFGARIKTGSAAEFNQLDYHDVHVLISQFIRQVEDLRIPNDLILYGRTLGLLHGLATMLDPSVNIFAIARPHFMKFLFPQQDGD